MEWLAEIPITWILLAVGVLTGLYLVLRYLSQNHYPSLRGTAENVQVVVVVIIAVFLVIRPFVFQAFYIPSGSMEPTLMPPDTSTGRSTPGDRILANKLLYLLSNPRRGDIAVFKAPRRASPEEKEFVKRVIGLPGETLEVVPPRLLVDGQPAVRLTEDWNVDGIPLTTGRQIQTEGRAADPAFKLAYHAFPVQVTATRTAHVTCTPNAVQIDGKEALADPAGRIRAEEGLGGYGESPASKGTVYSIDGDPRLMVLTGATVEYDPGHVLVDGRRLPEPYLVDTPRYAMAPTHLGANQYLMLGDNRNYSSDGHVWGPLTRDRFIGRAEILFWPLPRLRVFHWWLVAVLGAVYAAYQFLRKLRSSSRRPYDDPPFTPDPLTT